MPTFLPWRTTLAALIIGTSLFPAALSAAAQPAQPGAVPPAPAPAAAEDPLRRETPRGAFMGFVEASQRGDRAQAAEFLQWPPHKMAIGKEEAADQLRFILNHGFEGNLDRLSRDPAGSTNDSLPADRERVGAAVLANGERVDIFLARVTQSAGPAVWLIAADIVSEIPRMYEHAGLPEIERRLPKALTTASLGQLQLWVPLALLALLPVLYLVSRLLLWIVLRVTRLAFKLRDRSAPSQLPRAWKALSGPSAFLLTLGLHRLLAPYVGIPLVHRQYYSRTVTILLLVGVVRWLWRLVDLVTERVRDRLQPDNPRTAQSVNVLGRRLLKGTALAIALLAGLAAFGVDLTTTLAGLSIGGIALAFAAQKTLENVFGGISVLSDRSIVVGDVCQIGKYVGEVVDVGLRSMQLRTINRTVVYVPNGILATMEVENMSRRDKFLFNPTVNLRYETTLEQLQRVATDIKESLAADARIETPTIRARFARFGSYSLDIDVFAYVMAPDYPTFLGVQEELLVRIMGIVKQAGTGLAFPSQTMYVRQDQTAPVAPVVSPGTSRA
jgi:MscS family membrane protein